MFNFQQMKAPFFLFVTPVHIFLWGCKIKGSGLIRNRGEAGGEEGAVCEILIRLHRIILINTVEEILTEY